MAKGIIVVDMPERCAGCRARSITNENYAFCGQLGFDYQINEYMTREHSGKPDWCPISPMPIKKTVKN